MKLSNKEYNPLGIFMIRFKIVYENILDGYIW